MFLWVIQPTKIRFFTVLAIDCVCGVLSRLGDCGSEPAMRARGDAVSPPVARLSFAYGTAMLCDGGLLQFESSPIETSEMLGLEAAWSVGGCFGAKRPAWLRKTGVRDAFLEQS